MTDLHGGRLRWLTGHVTAGGGPGVRQVRAGGAVSIGTASGGHLPDAHSAAAIQVQAAA